MASTLVAGSSNKPTIGALHLESQRRELLRLLQELPASLLKSDPRFSALHNKLFPNGSDASPQVRDATAQHYPAESYYHEAAMPLNAVPSVPALALAPKASAYPSRVFMSYSDAKQAARSKDSRSRVLAAAEAKVAEARAKLEAQRVVSRANQLCSRKFSAELLRPAATATENFRLHNRTPGTGTAGAAGRPSTAARHAASSSSAGAAGKASGPPRTLTPVEKAVHSALAVRSTEANDMTTTGGEPSGATPAAAPKFISAAPWRAVPRSPTAAAGYSADSRSRNYIEAQPNGHVATRSNSAPLPHRSVHAKQIASKPALRLNTKKAATGGGGGGGGGGGKDVLASTTRSSLASSKQGVLASSQRARPKSAPVDTSRYSHWPAGAAVGGVSRNTYGSTKLERVQEA